VNISYENNDIILGGFIQMYDGRMGKPECMMCVRQVLEFTNWQETVRMKRSNDEKSISLCI